MTGRAIADVDLAAISANCARLKSMLPAATELCAVVKADGYGHGAVGVSAAALRGGASRLAVATASEAVQISSRHRDVPVLTLGALTDEELRAVLAARSEVTVWREEFRRQIAERAGARGVSARVHVKYDSGMGRAGNPDREQVLALVRACAEDPRLELAGLWTHFASADALGNRLFADQLARFEALADVVRSEFPGVTIHAANSAATLRSPRVHFDMVRCGIAIYGLDPYQVDPRRHGLRPALSLRSYVADKKLIRAGAGVGYGPSWRAAEDTWVALVPIGYGDGVRRALSNRAKVLIGGRRRPLVGTISMDNLTVSLGSDDSVPLGAEVVLIGEQGEEAVLAEELARRLGTINYEVCCGIGPRVPRRTISRAG